MTKFVEYMPSIREIRIKEVKGNYTISAPDKNNELIDITTFNPISDSLFIKQGEYYKNLLGYLLSGYGEHLISIELAQKLEAPALENNPDYNFDLSPEKFELIKKLLLELIVTKPETLECVKQDKEEIITPNLIPFEFLLKNEKRWESFTSELIEKWHGKKDAFSKFVTFIVQSKNNADFFSFLAEPLKSEDQRISNEALFDLLTAILSKNTPEMDEIAFEIIQSRLSKEAFEEVQGFIKYNTSNDLFEYIQKLHELRHDIRDDSGDDLKLKKYLQMYYLIAKLPENFKDGQVEIFLQDLVASSHEAPSLILLSRRKFQQRNLDTRFTAATYNNLFKVFTKLLELGADINAIGNNDHTPLHCAVITNRFEMFVILLSKGANPDMQDHWLNTPLHYAVKNKNLEMIKLLLKHKPNLELRNREEKTPLAIAVSSGEAEIAQFLLEAGAKIENIGAVNLPFQKEKIEFAKQFIKDHPELNLNAQNKVGKTALHLATLEDNLELLEYLLAHKANPNITEKDGTLPLHRAILPIWVNNVYSDSKIALRLIETTTDLNKDYEGRGTLIFLAVRRGDAAIIDALLAKNVELNSATDLSNSPLHYAITNKQNDTALKLIAKGAKITSLDKAFAQEHLNPLLEYSKQVQNQQAIDVLENAIEQAMGKIAKTKKTVQNDEDKINRTSHAAPEVAQVKQKSSAEVKLNFYQNNALLASPFVLSLGIGCGVAAFLTTGAILVPLLGGIAVLALVASIYMAGFGYITRNDIATEVTKHLSQKLAQDKLPIQERQEVRSQDQGPSTLVNNQQTKELPRLNVVEEWVRGIR